ncbi:sigma factor-like helix-turn-helix DNA-binding protein [Streptomyces klenkii]|uniref:sigma factor-like helix-turn-helix DNA-binding protein n=1 Tax=Streptomyces klenkii TaxID=1420899 RepID=UPI0033AEEC28
MVKQILAGMPARTRQIVLAYYAGRSATQIAAALGISLWTVHRTIARLAARQRAIIDARNGSLTPRPQSPTEQ